MTRNVQSNRNSSLEIGQSNQDLIISKNNNKWKKWIIGIIVFLIIVALIVAASFLVINDVEDKFPSKMALSLEDMFDGKIYPENFNATWISDNELLYMDKKENLILFNVDNNISKTIISASDPFLSGFFLYELSADKNFIVLGYYIQKIYRHSYKARFTIVDLTTMKHFKLTYNNYDDFNLFQWSTVGNGFIFIYKNNIFYRNSVNSTTIKLTQDKDFIYNGIPDWVNEEEVFSSNKALWFSPDGKKLVYGRFDDSETPIMVLPIYGEPGNRNFQYPLANYIKYPKAGTNNPFVSLHYVDLDNNTNTQILSPPEELKNLGPILTAVEWANNDIVVAIWKNRVQNKAAIMGYKFENVNVLNGIIIKMLSESKGWLELFTAPLFSKDGLQLVLILNQEQKNNLGGYRHIALLSTTEDSQIVPLTEGPYVVIEILGWDHERNLIYYLANIANNSAVQHVYGVHVDTKKTVCLSCGVKSKNNQEDCLFNSAVFSKDYSNYLLNCGGPDVPYLTIRSMNNNKIFEWEINNNIIELVRKKIIPKIMRLSIDVAGGFKAQVYLNVPPNIDKSGETKYPMLISVYAGPDSTQNVEKFNLGWGSYLSTNKSIIYGTIDGRSSGLKGSKLLFESYRKLGTVEIIDQINVTRQLQEKFSFIDEKRTAIWGWSYGGYATGMVLATDDKDIFKCGISVAPVTDWSLYDSIYTERYMGLPDIEDNYKGYAKANLLTKYKGLKNKKYFLIHGTYDDNVHYQQSMMWAKVLEKNDILFRQLSYPDEDHSLSSVRPHLYHSLENFLLNECFYEK